MSHQDIASYLQWLVDTQSITLLGLEVLTATSLRYDGVNWYLQPSKVTSHCES